MPKLVNFVPANRQPAPGWTLQSSETMAQTPWIRIESELWQTPGRDGEVRWAVAHRKAAISVAARLPNGQLLMVRQERVSLRGPSLEFVAGQIDEVEMGDDPKVVLDTIERELEEEAGYRIPDDAVVHALGYYFTSPGFTNELIYLFFVDGVEPLPTGNRPDRNEVFLGCEFLTPEQLRQMLISGEIRDSLSHAMYAQLAARGLLTNS